MTVITCIPNVPNGVPYEGYRNRIWPKVEMVDGIRVVRVWTFLAANAGNLKRIMNYVSYMFSSVFAALFWVKRPHVIVATSPQFFCGWAGVFASWLRWVPLVLEIRDIWPESIVTVGAMKKGIAVRILEYLERAMYRSARHIVAVGDGYRKNVESKAAVSDRISVVTNGVDATLFRPSEPSHEFIGRWNLENKYVCSYVGTLGMAHGLDVTIRAAELLRKQGHDDVVFMLVGDGANRAKLEEEVAQNGLSDAFRFTGRLDKKLMPDVLASSSVMLVHLKKSELFETVIPSKIFEAMAMERPIIMGVKGESAEIVKKSKAGVFMEPENESDLVRQILDLKSDEGRYRELKKNAREFVIENYSRDVLANRMLDVLGSVKRA